MYTLTQATNDAAHAVPYAALREKRVKRRPEREAATSGKPRHVRGKMLVRCGLCGQPVSIEPCRVCTRKGNGR